MSILSPVSAPTSFACDPLRRALAEGKRRAEQRRRPVLVSVAEPLPAIDPLAAFAAGTHTAQERLYWEHQDRRSGGRLALAGIGVAHQIVAEGRERFSAVAGAWRDLLDGALLTGGEDLCGVGPLLLGGFSFDPLRARTATWTGFPDALLTLPRFTLAAVGEECWLTTNVLVEPDGNAAAEAVLRARAELLIGAGHAVTHAPGKQAPYELEDVLPADQWRAMVARTAREIREERFAKVVLARQARLTLTNEDDRFDVAAALAHLRNAYPSSFLFAVAQPGSDPATERIFLSATPERLLHLHGGMMETSCLAGSIQRGASPEEDLLLGAQLLASAKDRREHAVVTDVLREALAPLCHTLTVPDAPVLLRLANVQHLHTPIHGRLAAQADGVPANILHLIERLHPTPAVGGFPRLEALQAIREREHLDRGWYAAPVGWLDRHGEGEFAVAIRSALLEGPREALLFAGCGIVGDSDPQSEYVESRIKMNAMLSALTSTKGQ